MMRRLTVLNKELRERFNRSGVGWITTTVLNGRRVLRVTIMNPRTRAEHLQRLLDGPLSRGGADGLTACQSWLRPDSLAAPTVILPL